MSKGSKFLIFLSVCGCDLPFSYSGQYITKKALKCRNGASLLNNTNSLVNKDGNWRYLAPRSSHMVPINIGHAITAINDVFHKLWTIMRRSLMTCIQMPKSARIQFCLKITQKKVSSKESLAFTEKMRQSVGSVTDLSNAQRA